MQLERQFCRVRPRKDPEQKRSTARRPQGPLYRSNLTVRAHAHIFSLRVSLRTMHPMLLHWLKVFERSCVCFSKVIPSATVSHLGVPGFTPFPPVFTSSTATPTPQTGIRLNPCATPLWGGPSGHLAGPTLNTGYEPKFCTDVSRASTRRSIFRPERAASSLRMTRRSPLLRTLICLDIQEQAAAATR